MRIGRITTGAGDRPAAIDEPERRRGG